MGIILKKISPARFDSFSRVDENINLHKSMVMIERRLFESMEQICSHKVA